MPSQCRGIVLNLPPRRVWLWHMDTLARICKQDEGLLLATPYRVVDVTDPEAVAAGVAWQLELTGSGGEGMVVKKCVNALPDHDDDQAADTSCLGT
jgi:hypothetical protein